MQRPASIVRYQYLYFAAIALIAANTAMTWRSVAQSRQAREAALVLGPWALPLAAVFLFTVMLTLWYFTARQPSRVAKWIVVALFVFRLVGFVLGVAQGTMPRHTADLVALAALVIEGLAVVLLFRRDARRWFGESA